MIVLKILLIIIAVIVILLHFSVTVYVKGSTDGKFEFKVKYLFFTIFPHKEKPKKPKKEKKKKRKRQKKEKIGDDEFGDDLEAQLEQAFKELEEYEKAAQEQGELSLQTAQAQEETCEEETDEEPKEEALSKEELKEKKKQDKLRAKEERARAKEEKRLEKEKRRAEKAAQPSKAQQLKGKYEDLKAKWEFIKPYIPMGWKYFKKLLKAVRFEGVRINIDSGKEDAAESAKFYGKLQAALFNVLHIIAAVFTLKLKEANVNCIFGEKRFDARGEVTVRVRPSTMIAIAFCLGVNFLRKFLPWFIKKKLRERKAAKAAKKAAEKAAQEEEKSKAEINDGKVDEK